MLWDARHCWVGWMPTWSLLTSRDAAGECRLYSAFWTENLAWQKCSRRRRRRRKRRRRIKLHTHSWIFTCTHIWIHKCTHNTDRDTYRLSSNPELAVSYFDFDFICRFRNQVCCDHWPTTDGCGWFAEEAVWGVCWLCPQEPFLLSWHAHQVLRFSKRTNNTSSVSVYFSNL